MKTARQMISEAGSREAALSCHGRCLTVASQRTFDEIGKLMGRSAVLAAFFAVTVRYRRLVLGISIVLAVVLVVGRRLSDLPDLIVPVATLLVGVLGVLAWRRPSPAAVVVKPEVRAFVIEPSASQILIGVALMFLATQYLGRQP